MSEKNNDWLRGLFVGGLIGLALGVLLAPKSGKETRDDITRKANELLDKAKEEYEKAAEKGKAAYDSTLHYLNDLNTVAKEKVEEVEQKAGDLAKQGIETIQDNKNRLKKAIDAGLEAYREEAGKEKA
jgi:gas vesicle protein